MGVLLVLERRGRKKGGLMEAALVGLKQVSSIEVRIIMGVGIIVKEEIVCRGCIMNLSKCLELDLSKDNKILAEKAGRMHFAH